MDESKKVLVITPHPDDAESGAGGTIAKWSSQGANIALVVCTNGNKGTSDRNIDSVKIAALRKMEQSSWCGLSLDVLSSSTVERPLI